MKKLLLSLAAISALLISCQKSSPEDATFIKLDAPELQKQAVSIDFPNGAEYKSIELMEAGTYVIRKETVRSTSSLDGYLYGSYTYENGVYTLSGDFQGTIKIEGNNITVNQEVIVAQEVKCSDENISDEYKQLCRAWEVKITRASATLSDTKIDLDWNGCDLNKILEDVAEKINHTMELGEGYVLESVSFSQFGKMVFQFKNGECFVANWAWGKEGGEISYEWLEEYMGTEILINAKASVEFSGEGVILNFSTTVGNYNCNITFGLVEKK